MNGMTVIVFRIAESLAMFRTQVSVHRQPIRAKIVLSGIYFTSILLVRIIQEQA